MYLYFTELLRTHFNCFHINKTFVIRQFIFSVRVQPLIRQQAKPKPERPKHDYDYDEDDHNHNDDHNQNDDHNHKNDYNHQNDNKGNGAIIGPVHTFVKTDKNANYKWGVRHHVANKRTP